MTLCESMPAIARRLFVNSKVFSNIAFTHDTVIQNVVATLNFTSFAASGPPPLDHIPKHRSFISSQ